MGAFLGVPQVRIRLAGGFEDGRNDGGVVSSGDRLLKSHVADNKQVRPCRVSLRANAFMHGPRAAEIERRTNHLPVVGHPLAEAHRDHPRRCLLYTSPSPRD